MAKQILEACFIVSGTKQAREAADRLRAAWISVGGSTFTHDALFKASPLGHWNPAPSGDELRRRIVERNKSSLGFPSLDLHAIFVVGGDGSLLEAVRTCHATDFDAPFIGWNMGNVGFWMHDIPTSDREFEAHLRTFMDGTYDAIELPLLTAKLIGSDGSETVAHAFNEVTIRRRTGQTANLLLTVDGVELATIRGDGVMLATSQGSTAYALSVGGSAMDPLFPALVVAPINPWPLAEPGDLRIPVVLGPMRKLIVDVLERGKRPMFVEVDSAQHTDVVRLEASIDFRSEAMPPVRLLYPRGFGGPQRFPRRINERLRGLRWGSAER